LRKETVRKSVLIFLLFRFLSLSANDSESLIIEASEDWLWGRWEEAELNFRRAAEISTGELKQICNLKSLQIRYDMGQYFSLLEEAAYLSTQGLNQKIKRDALIIEIKSMEKLALYDQAYKIIDLYDESFSRDPVWQFMAWEFYSSKGKNKEADRAGWIIRQYFPKSPEALLLTGESTESIKPSQLLFKK
jgi:tetratricopeptide (TPR) repeat protein